MSDLVIDASVAIKWVSVEEGTLEAVALRRHAVAAPEMLIAECANILWKKVRRSELTAEEAGFAARLLTEAEIELMPMRRHFERAVAIAIELDHPAYDCLYLALAEAERVPFVTADDRLLRKLSQPGSARYRDRTVRLADAAAL
jgi:predicted nucleic acid-binding protein